MRELVNYAVNELNELSKSNYDRFQIMPDDCYGDQSTFMLVNNYRAKVGGLIARLHGEYFADETAPFNGMPSTVITQSQGQSQSVDIQVLLDIRGKIEQELLNHVDGSKEKRFLQGVKETLGGVTDSAQLLRQVLNAAGKFGLSPENISRLLGL